MFVIDAQSCLYCVIGYPVKHPLSHLIHNSLFQKYGINAVYPAFEVPEYKFLAQKIKKHLK